MEKFALLKDLFSLAGQAFIRLFKSDRKVVLEWLKVLDDVEDIFIQCTALGGSFRLPWLINNKEVTLTELDRRLKLIQIETRSRSIRSKISELRTVLTNTWAASKYTHSYMAFDNGTKTISDAELNSLNIYSELQRSHAAKGKLLIAELRNLLEKRLLKQ